MKIFKDNFSEIIDKKHYKLYKIIRCNMAITSFRIALIGSIMTLIFGYYNIPVFSTLYYISVTLGDLITCRLNPKLLQITIEKLNKKYVLVQIIDTLVCVLGFIVLLFNVKIGALILYCDNIVVMGFSNAYGDTYKIKVDDIITKKNVNNRHLYNTALRTLSIVASIAGTVCNIIIYSLSEYLEIKNIFVYKGLIVIFGVMLILDLFCSIIESRELSKLEIEK